jgi:hypothetical protein
MIDIRKIPDGNFMIISSVSDFIDSMGYCEFRIKHFLEGMKAPETKVTLEGTEFHKKEVDYEREHFEFVTLSQEELENIKKDIEFAREGIYTRFLTKMKYGKKSLSLLIIGRADKIVRSKGMLIVEETKTTENTEKYLAEFEPYEDQKIQVLLYLNSSYTSNPDLTSKERIQIPHKRKAWIVNIKDKKTGKSVKIFKGVQTKEAKEFLREKMVRFALVVMGKLQPEHHKNVKKCRSCRFFDDCEYKITV